MNAIDKLMRDATLIVFSHDEKAFSVCTSFYEIKKGKLVG
jgi:ABC-type lipoprotein export system ATPase subunit